MTIAANGGPHTVAIYRKTTTPGPNRVPQDSFAYVSSPNCFVQPLDTAAITDTSKPGSLTKAMITFFKDPGQIDKKTVIIFQNGSVKEIHEFNGFRDESNLRRIWILETVYKTTDLTDETFPNPP